MSWALEETSKVVMKEEKNSTLESLSCIGQTEMEYLASKKKETDFFLFLNALGLDQVN